MPQEDHLTSHDPAPAIVRTYRAADERSAWPQYDLDRHFMESEGYFPTGKVWQSHGWGVGTLTVTYERRT